MLFMAWSSKSCREQVAVPEVWMSAYERTSWIFLFLSEKGRIHEIQ